MAVLPIIEVPDPRLREKSVPVENFDQNLQTLIDDMFETMYKAPGIGLAAIQVGVAKRLLVIDLQSPDENEGKDNDKGKDKNKHTPLVFINPEITPEGDEESIYNEGCLSVPDQYADVKRPKVIHAKWLDRNGMPHEERLDGLLATCLQHEIDHLEGILFIDHLSRLKRGILMKKLLKERKNREEVY
ncbi:MAG: peptide deformylase [Zymomonas mobilis subsp. pomaceae]|uniref:Peptide deformylase n=1 Tax=Zymomonas mobilis subsp. pomaceae (strain ATCC 29192 / DSM 22645 / JCM 10191 / CCUG 17912 / NBRC 13757 / NCIMB 11200 / NRRL B-4491 / Barker I) TaxID=579138 RepID=F8EVE6_ZYMMT|nr:peptide deformylase [Zymomonas mobilis]AEI37353.1 peptide deformylase [Zymomonas mobilis subsp. pomaceae ATCC 29192]MDX5948721.1 peptide deformylase [Zymomonas mobilis subsp. pomaceae]GEB88526.1 peptide deformylase [Zymomonas mobilis subsp. pomaceae]